MKERRKGNNMWLLYLIIGFVIGYIIGNWSGYEQELQFVQEMASYMDKLESKNAKVKLLYKGIDRHPKDDEFYTEYVCKKIV